MQAEDLPRGPPPRASDCGPGSRACSATRVAEVRGEGLMQAVGLEASVTAGAMAEALLARGVIGRALPYANSMAFSPPLIISDDEVDELVGASAAVLDELA